MFYEGRRVNSFGTTPRRITFEPLNAKKLERLAALNEPGIVYTPQCFGILTWYIGLHSQHG